MKKYIGTKQIEAEPMTMGEAYRRGLLQAGRVPRESEKSKAGYYVRYEDGYESWSPADVFEKAYKVADTFLDRMRIEYDELVSRTYKAEEFYKSSKCKELLTDEEKRLLYEQIDIMRNYIAVMNARIYHAEVKLRNNSDK